METARHVGEHLLFLARKCLCCRFKDADLDWTCCGSVPGARDGRMPLAAAVTLLRPLLRNLTHCSFYGRSA